MNDEEEIGDMGLSIKGLVYCWTKLGKTPSFDEMYGEIKQIIKRSWRIGYRLSEGLEMLEEDYNELSVLKEMGLVNWGDEDD